MSERGQDRPVSRSRTGRPASTRGGFLGMLKYLSQRVREKEFQRTFGAALLGKVLGLVAIFAIIAAIATLFFSPATAADAPAAAPYISPINTAWTLIAAFLVFFMQAG